MLKDEIYCLMYTINPSNFHRPIAMSVRSGTPEMGMAMAPLEQRECVPASSGANPSMAAPTLMILAQRTPMISEALA